MKMNKRQTIKRKKSKLSVASEDAESGFTSDDFSSNEEDTMPVKRRTTMKRAITRTDTSLPVSSNPYSSKVDSEKARLQFKKHQSQK